MLTPGEPWDAEGDACGLGDLLEAAFLGEVVLPSPRTRATTAPATIAVPMIASHSHSRDGPRRRGGAYPG